MNRCVLHIGMHKTGSTSIQQSFDGFANERFVYAGMGRDPNHSLAVYSMFSARPERHHLHRNRNGEAVRAYIDQVWADLERSMAAMRDRTLLISGEDIGALQPPELAKLHDEFRKRFDKLTIVGYVRPPAGFMASQFQQRAKSGNVLDWFDERMYRNYRASFGKFDDVFSRENVHLYKFDPPSFPSGDVVRDFCKRLDIDLPAGQIVRRNESLSRQAVALLHTYSRFGEAYGSRTLKGQEGTKLGQLIGGVDKFRFSPDLVRPVLDRNRADIEWMEARLGQSLQEELGEHQPGDVREEQDLLRPDPQAVDRLLKLLGSAAPKGAKGETPAEVALLVHALREKHAPGGWARHAQKLAQASETTPTSNPRRAPLAISDLIDGVQSANPNLLDATTREQAQVLIGKVFAHINATLAATQEGIVTYSGLGRFRVTKIEQDVRGTKAVRTRIVFRPADDDMGKTMVD